MKKYIWLFMATLALLSMISMSGYAMQGSVTDAEVITLKEKTMDSTLSANGKLQYKAGKNISAGSAGIMNTLYVKNGDSVKKGDLLFTYYKLDDAYTAMASQYAGAGGVEALIKSASGLGNLDELMGEVKKYCPIESVYSEYSGIVTGLKYKADELFEKNAAVMKISDKLTLEIPVNINENSISKIKKGQKADVVFSAIPDRHYKASVTGIADEATVTSGLTGKETTVEVTLTLEDGDKSLKAGYSAACTIVTSTDNSVLVLPYDCIRTDENGDYVFAARDGRAKKIYIKTGKEYKDGAEITEGLKSGEKIITGYDSLSDGQRIEITDRTVQTYA